MHTLIIGLDAFDPVFFEDLYNQGKMPVLGKYVRAGGYSPFTVSNPPQSEVSWTSIATGASPGSHGMFDFVHRSPGSYALSPSLLVTKGGIGGAQFAPPHTARTLFEQATIQGYPATSLWWPATFPARMELPVRTLPGLGTPDIQGRLGVGAVFTVDAELTKENLKTPVEVLAREGKDRYRGAIKGPKKDNTAYLSCPFTLEMQEGGAMLRLGKQSLSLEVGVWSPIIEVPFKINALFSMRAITRLILIQAAPEPRLYCLPVQIHPLSSPWRYATPPGFIKQTWNNAGPFLTLGWPQDTTALEEGWINDGQFLALCDSIFESRERVLNYHLQNFREGVLACVFDTLDRIQHMYWKTHPDLIATWYTRLDALVGRLEDQLVRNKAGTAKVIVVSDHGFGNFDYKVHLNRWLIERGYLTTTTPNETSLRGADWSSSFAYGLGLNSLYLNLQGREGRGCVHPEQKANLIQRLRNDLLAWVGPDGRHVVHEVYDQTSSDEPLAAYGPDLLVGYTPGYRASAETGLGQWKTSPLEVNCDHWSADHCFDPALVPGVLFCNQGLDFIHQPSYRDFPELATGWAIDKKHSSTPPSGQDEDQDLVEERLKSLGYL